MRSNFDIKYINTSQNIADFLSRLPINEPENTDLDCSEISVQSLIKDSEIPIHINKIIEEIHKDVTLKRI